MARKRLVLYVSTESYDLLATRASADRRSVSECGAIIIEEHLVKPPPQHTKTKERRNG
jgi:hypothetical protein